MKTAAVIIEKWKLPIFEKHLKEAGYTWTQAAAIMPNMLTLRVQYEWVANLQPVIEAANNECRRQQQQGVSQ